MGKSNFKRWPLIVSILLGSVFSSSLATTSNDDRDDTVLTFGIVPQQTAGVLARSWGPLLHYVSQKAGVSLEFRTAKDIPTFQKRLAAGAYDLAYMNPYHYVVFHKAPGYRAIAREKNKRIHGILVVRKDSPLQGVSELNGESLAFPAPAAFAASLIPRAYLRRQGIAITPVYVDSHDSVYLNVTKGFFIAGGGVERTLTSAQSAVKEQLRILWTTPGYTPHAIAAHPRIPTAIVARVRDALIALSTDPAGQELLQTLNFNEGLTSAQDTDWDDIRALHLETLDASLSNLTAD